MSEEGVQLRDGERPDEDLDTHARRNLEQIKIAEEAREEAEDDG